MEQSQISENTIINYDDQAKPILFRNGKKKNNRRMHIFKAALTKMRGRSTSKKMLHDDDDNSKSVWRKVVGSMRPLHLQGDQSPRSDSESIGEEDTHSPSPLSSCYGSAVGLNEMVQNDEDDCNDADGDEKIDAKADEFIAQFYQQMRLQNLNEVNLDYEARSQRSLGMHD